MGGHRFWRDPALPFAESRRAADSRACYRAHTHPTLSIGLVEAGRSVFSSGQRLWPLTPGSLVCVPPGCAHACNPAAGHTWSYQMLHLDAAWAATVLHETGQPPLPAEARVLADAPACLAFQALQATLFSCAVPAAKEAALRGYLQEGRWRDGTPLAAAPAVPAPVARVLALLQADPARAWTLAELANHASLSPQALVRAFRRATGLTPHAWLLDLRVNAARERLRAGEAVAAVAADLGFCDQSHLHQHFRRQVAATPGDYGRTG